MRIVITGAAGNLGRIVTRELDSSHELVRIDRRPTRGGVKADISRHAASDPGDPRARLARWDRSFSGAGAVIHLAAAPDPETPWSAIVRHNIKGTWNVLDAAARHRVPHFVFASSVWAVRETERALAADGDGADEPKIGSDAFPRPATAYGLGKGMVEMAGRMFVDEGRLASFIAIRFGYVAPADRLSSADEWLRQRWIGPADTATLVRRCVESDRSGFHVVYGVSAQADSPFDLAGTRDLLGWEPEESADRVGPGAVTEEGR